MNTFFVDVPIVNGAGALDVSVPRKLTACRITGMYTHPDDVADAAGSIQRVSLTAYLTHFQPFIPADGETGPAKSDVAIFTTSKSGLSQSVGGLFYDSFLPVSGLNIQTSDEDYLVIGLRSCHPAGNYSSYRVFFTYEL